MKVLPPTYFYVVSVNRDSVCRPAAKLKLPDDAAWIYTAGTRACDQIADQLGDASDLSVQVDERFAIAGDVEALIRHMRDLVRNTPRALFVVPAAVALVLEADARVQDTRTCNNECSILRCFDLGKDPVALSG